jgi:hypothetical protein
MREDKYVLFIDILILVVRWFSDAKTKQDDSQKTRLDPAIMYFTKYPYKLMTDRSDCFV